MYHDSWYRRINIYIYICLTIHVCRIPCDALRYIGPGEKTDWKSGLRQQPFLYQPLKYKMTKTFSYLTILFPAHNVHYLQALSIWASQISSEIPTCLVFGKYLCRNLDPILKISSKWCLKVSFLVLKLFSNFKLPCSGFIVGAFPSGMKWNYVDWENPRLV